MPTVELDIGGTPTRVQVSDGYKPEDLDHIAQVLTNQQGTPWSRAGQYLTHKGSQFVGALQGVGKDVENLVTGQPYGTGFPGERSGWDTAGDVATTAAPVAAIMSGVPGLQAAGLGLTAGTYTRAKGFDEPTADLANAATQVGTGLLQAGGAAAGLRGTINKRFTGVRDALTQSGKLMTADSPEGQQLFWDLAKARSRFPAESGEAQAAKDIMEKLGGSSKMLAKKLGGGQKFLPTGLTYGDIDDALTKIGGSNPSMVAGILRGARRTLAAGTPEAGELAGAEQWAGLNRMSLPNLLPSGLQKLGRAGGALGTIGAVGEAARQAYHGNYTRAAGTLGAGVLGVGSVGQALAAAPALGRAALAVGSQAPGLAQSAQPATGEDLPASPGILPTPEQGGPAPAPRANRLTALPGPYGRELAAVSQLAGVPAELIRAHMKLESSGNPNAIGDQGRSIGLMQIQPGTFAVVAKQASQLLGRTANIHNPFDNLLAGGLLLHRYLDKTNGDWQAAAQLYNGGEGTTGNPHTRWYAGEIAKNFLGGG